MGNINDTNLYTKITCNNTRDNDNYTHNRL